MARCRRCGAWPWSCRSIPTRSSGLTESWRQGFLYTVKGRGSFVGSVSRLREARRQALKGKLSELAKEAQSLEMDRAGFVKMAEESWQAEAQPDGQPDGQPDRQPGEQKKEQADKEGSV